MAARCARAAVGKGGDPRFNFTSRGSVYRDIGPLQALGKSVKSAIPSAAAALLAACSFFGTYDWARSLTGGKYVDPDDIGAKASVALPVAVYSLST